MFNRKIAIFLKKCRKREFKIQSVKCKVVVSLRDDILIFSHREHPPSPRLWRDKQRNTEIRKY